MTVRVLVAEDQDLVRSGLRLIVEHQDGLEVVAEASDGAQAVAAALGHRPDVILMDIRMPGVDGVEALRRLHRAWPGPAQPPAVLVLTTFDLDEYVLSALDAGAVGYLLKNSSPDTLTAAIRTAAAGGTVLSPAVTDRLVARLRAETAASSGVASGRVDGLTDLDREVLVLVAHGLSNAQIAGRLGCTEVTVKSRVARVLTKLGVDNRVQAAIVAYESGMVRLGLP
jgi:DNA-binding NarL/FixJ family response regulator